MFATLWWLPGGLILSSEGNLGHGDHISPPLAMLNTPEGELESFSLLFGSFSALGRNSHPLQAALFVFTSSTVPTCLGRGALSAATYGE